MAAYLDGKLLQSPRYRSSRIMDVPTFIYSNYSNTKIEVRDEPIHVWQFAFDLREVPGASDEVVVLYHYTDETCFRHGLRVPAVQRFVLRFRV